MRKMQRHIVKGKRVFVGLEDSKRNWKLCVRCEGMIVDETSMPTEYENLRNYLRRDYPDCEIGVIYGPPPLFLLVHETYTNHNGNFHKLITLPTLS